MPNNFNIKYPDHFKLYIQLKDKIIFETELFNNGVDFHVDDNQVLSGSDTRYFLLSKDNAKIDEVLRNNGIIASTDTINVTDYQDQKKAQKLYLYAVIIVVILMYLASVIFD